MDRGTDRASRTAASHDGSAADHCTDDSERSTREQLLDAAVETAIVHGITKLSVGDVAKRAGLSRQTLYRHFASKDALIAAVVTHETTALIAQVVGAASSIEDPRDSLEAAFLAALRATRDHPLLDRLIRTEPEALLPLLTTDGGPVITQVRTVVELLVSVRRPDLDAVALRRISDVVTRLLISYAVSAPDDPPEVVASYVATFLTQNSPMEAPR